MPVKSLLGLCIAGFIGNCGPAPVDETASAMQRAFAPPPVARQTLSGNYLAGQFAQHHRDWETATRYVGRVLEYDPDNPELQKRAMILAMGSGETSRAISQAREILKTDPQNVLAILFVTIDSFSRQDYAATIQTLSTMPEGGMADFVRPLLLAWAKAGQGKTETDALAENSPLHAYHAFLIADYLGKTDKIDSYLEKILQDTAIDIYELKNIADIYAKHGKTDKAKELYETILATQPDNEQILTRLARIKEGKPAASPGDLTPVSSPEQGAAEAIFDMARVLFSEYSDDSAMVFSRMALHLNPALSEARILLANIMVRNNRLDRAISYYRSLTPDDENYIPAQQRAADLLEREGRSEKAAEILKKLYDQKKDLNTLILTGDMYRRAEDYESAVKIYNQAAEALGGNIPKKYWHLLYTRGIAYERLGETERAEKDLKAALSFQPDDPYVLNYLGYSWANRGENLEDSLRMIEKAVTLQPDDGYIVDSLGWVLYRMGKHQASAETLELAVELQPYDPTINDHLGDAYWRVGRKREARFQWERALNYAGEEGNTSEEGMEEKLRAKLQNGLSEKDPSLKEAKNAGEDPLKR
ncbi:MAG: tetratricopeptide repeat protein [Rhodospirillales bacterium]|nr:tetratricopeptide repeat protein [Alphaproteobacteria bacterium]USO04452.1 MAG: tetratricopeptide repeat protein [Rhodospirillales bacterium]